MTRSERGAANLAQVTGSVGFEPTTLYESSYRDFVHADVWTRSGLGIRERLLISLAGTAVTKDAAACEIYVRGALSSAHLSFTELREAALQLAVYDGWASGGVLDRAITSAAKEMGFTEPVFEPLPDDPSDPAERIARGQDSFRRIAQIDAPPPFTPYLDTGVLNFVMSELWTRPGLDERSRRFITLVGAAFSGAPTPMRSHSYSALKSGDVTKDELLEFCLHFALYGGWPRGAAFQNIILEQARRVEEGLPFQP